MPRTPPGRRIDYRAARGGRVSGAIPNRIPENPPSAGWGWGARWLILLCAGHAANRALAHADAAGSVGATWEFDPWVVVPLFLTAAVYASGLRWLRCATGVPGKLRREAWCFAGGWMALVVALISPVHTLSREFFWVHMTQHELLMIVAAPLLVLGRPLLVMGWAFPTRAFRVAAARVRAGWLGSTWRMASNLFVATALHAVALWIWHVPALFDATTRHEGVHALQHVSFAGTALLFWQAVYFGRQRAAGYGLAVLMLFLTAGHSGALGALLTFAAAIWYPAYGDVAAARALSAIEDQQLGGLIMWVPAGVAYVASGLVLFAAWLRESDRRGGAASKINRSPIGPPPVSR